MASGTEARHAASPAIISGSGEAAFLRYNEVRHARALKNAMLTEELESPRGLNLEPAAYNIQASY